MSEKPKKIVLATKNDHKVQELNDMLSKTGVEIISAKEVNPDVTWVENGTTFEANALIKAKAIREFWDGPILADDSGLIVDALNGAPGIYSSRFAGEEATDADNNEKLLRELINTEDRSARFVCCLCYLSPSNSTHFFNGTLEGTIARDFAGKGGFGYDPIFMVKETGKHLALSSAEEKNKISHRSNALKLFKNFLDKM